MLIGIFATLMQQAVLNVDVFDAIEPSRQTGWILN